jgi:hypothetical protein
MKIEKLKYLEPTKKDLIFIIPYFNYCNDKNMKNNILFVSNLLYESKIPFYIAEILINNDISIFEKTKYYDNIILFRTNSYLFYKENIINLMVEKIKKENIYNKVGILDGDILFMKDNWYDQISKKLDKYDICQPYNCAFYLKKDSINLFQYDNYILSILKNEKDGHPGFIWCFELSFFDTFNFFEYTIIGGGDRVFSNILLIQKYEKENYFSISLTNYLSKIKNKNFSKCFCDMKIYHLFHGELSKRQYSTRNELLINLLKYYNKNDISELLEKNEFGLLQWKKEYLDYSNSIMMKYFNERKSL